MHLAAITSPPHRKHFANASSHLSSLFVYSSSPRLNNFPLYFPIPSSISLFLCFIALPFCLPLRSTSVLSSYNLIMIPTPYEASIQGEEMWQEIVSIKKQEKWGRKENHMQFKSGLFVFHVAKRRMPEEQEEEKEGEKKKYIQVKFAASPLV